jgi:hypothetical protein
LTGREGTQASRASDFAISRFRYPPHLFIKFEFSHLFRFRFRFRFFFLNEDQISEEIVVSSRKIQLHSNF